MGQRGWTAQGLTLVGEDERLWTVEEAARLLGPPCLSTIQVRQLISMWQLEPVGTRRPDRDELRGRRPRVYRAIDFIKAYDTLSRAA
jgi:hypothetical protein